MRSRLLTFAPLLALTLALPSVAFTQGTTPAATAAPSPLTRTILQTRTLVTQPGRDVITAVAELAVGGTAPRHFHTGEEFGYVLQGVAVVEQDGAPPRELKTGDVFFVPPNTPHLVRNTGTVPWKVVSNYLIETGKPLAVPAPKP